ncbi:MAG: alpha/beta hydrolase [Ignavibacteriae bacterium HGW-Ignavibacteriae-3]|nr:MAG: alpha/beta hydrolase [Ignavibacteriae bacterium HGW-Ignavibacteriae-3]
MNRDYSLSTSDGEKLKITSFINEQYFSGNTLVFVHGFKGFKDWGFGPYLGNYFADKGFFVITFNFSHNGIGENNTEFTELDKFAKNTYNREVRELSEILDSVRNGFFSEVDNRSDIGLIGHSRGGAVALLNAAERADLNAVVTWASISNIDRYSKHQKAEWRKNGFLDMLNSRTGQIMKMDVSLLDEIETESKSRLNIESAVKKLKIPYLIAHGDQDLAVKISEAEQLYSWSDKSQTEFFKIFGTGHTFDIVHPFAGTTEKFEKLLDETNKFFIKHLN